MRVQTPHPTTNRWPDLRAASLTEAARLAVQRTPVIDEAVQALLDFAANNPVFDEELRERAARHMIHEARADLRERIERPVWNVPDHAADRQTRAIRTLQSLFDWPLPNSDKRLGDATVEDLVAAQSWHEIAAKGETRRAEMYRQLRVLMERQHVAVVRDLPLSEVSTVLRSAAA